MTDEESTDGAYRNFLTGKHIVNIVNNRKIIIFCETVFLEIEWAEKTHHRPVLSLMP
jgi:hypothetical protein